MLKSVLAVITLKCSTHKWGEKDNTVPCIVLPARQVYTPLFIIIDTSEWVGPKPWKLDKGRTMLGCTIVPRAAYLPARGWEIALYITAVWQVYYSGSIVFALLRIASLCRCMSYGGEAAARMEGVHCARYSLILLFEVPIVHFNVLWALYILVFDINGGTLPAFNDT